MLAASSAKGNVTAWRPSVRPSVCPVLFPTLVERAAHTRRDSPEGSTRRSLRTYADGHATWHWRRVGGSVGDSDRCAMCRSGTDKAASWQRRNHGGLLCATQTTDITLHATCTNAAWQNLLHTVTKECGRDQ